MPELINHRHCTISSAVRRGRRTQTGREPKFILEIYTEMHGHRRRGRATFENRRYVVGKKGVLETCDKKITQVVGDGQKLENQSIAPEFFFRKYLRNVHLVSNTNKLTVISQICYHKYKSLLPSNRKKVALIFNV